MKIKNTISSVLFFAFLSAIYINITAFDDGIVGFTKKNGNELGCICHELFPDKHVTVLISGPAKIVVNDTAEFTLRITGGPSVGAGCDISTSLGKLFPSPSDTSIRRDESFPGAGFELTHRDPKLFAGGFAEFTFRYVAPSTPNVKDTIFANGNSVNLDFTSSRDQWNYADNFIISVIDRPLPVELSSFNFSVNNNNVDLIWVTSAEENNAGFDIERSDLSGNWMKKGYVAGKGNSNLPVSYTFTDKNLLPGKYNYRLKQSDINGNFKYYNLSDNVIISNPVRFNLSQNYPNPFNPSTKISYDIAAAGSVKLFVYDITGKSIAELVNKFQNPGSYSVEFDAGRFTSGTYFYRLESGNFTDVKKMFLIK